MDANEFISRAFWTDYMAEMEAANAEPESHVQILRNFMRWLDKRTAEGPVIDLRLVKNQTARVAVNRIMGVRDNE
jgi:hypothetical protein